MIAFNLFSVKTCSLQDNRIVVDGTSFQIDRIKELPMTKTGNWLVLVVMIIALCAISPSLYRAAVAHSAAGLTKLGSFVSIGSVSVVVLAYAFVVWMVARIVLLSRRCRGFWLVNDSKNLAIEYADSTDIDAALKELECSMGAAPGKLRMRKIKGLLVSVYVTALSFMLFVAFDNYFMSRRMGLLVNILLSCMVGLMTTAAIIFRQRIIESRWKE